MIRAATVAGLALVTLAAAGLHAGLAGASDSTPSRTTPPPTALPTGDHFQQAVSMNRRDLGCTPVDVPASRTLTLRTVLVEVASPSPAEPEVWLDVAIAQPTHTYHMRSPVVLRSQSPEGGRWTGELATTLYSGPADPHGASYRYLLCMNPEQGSWTTVYGLVAGDLDPLS